MVFDYLVGGWPTPLKNMTSTVGMMTFPIYGKNHVPNHQPVMLYTMYSQFMDAGVGHPNDVAQKNGLYPQCVVSVLWKNDGIRINQWFLGILMYSISRLKPYQIPNPHKSHENSASNPMMLVDHPYVFIARDWTGSPLRAISLPDGWRIIPGSQGGIPLFQIYPQCIADTPGKLRVCYWKWSSRNSWWLPFFIAWWCSTVMLNYQRASILDSV